MTDETTSGASSPEVAAFWQVARVRARLDAVAGELAPSPLGLLQPPAWSFGATPDQADLLLALVLDGTKTATAGALWDYEADGDEVPSVGELSIVVDSGGHPRALVVTTQVDVVPFDQVTAEHAYLEGEGDRSLRHWRDVHQWFFTEYAAHGRGFAYDMPVVLDRFKVLYQR